MFTETWALPQVKGPNGSNIAPIIYLTMTLFVPYILQTLEFIISNRTLVEEPFPSLAMVVPK